MKETGYNMLSKEVLIQQIEKSNQVAYELLKKEERLREANIKLINENEKILSAIYIWYKINSQRIKADNAIVSVLNPVCVSSIDLELEKDRELIYKLDKQVDILWEKVK